MNEKKFITRFAPSPTGYLHIGGARTALFNYLLAKANGGKMLLRIEDTDRARHTEEAVEAILNGLNWLGIEWEGEPISQFSRQERHREVAEEMVKAGHAYKCYASEAELDEMREKAKLEKKPIMYDGRWRDKAESEAPEGVKPVIRLKTPMQGETIVDDKVQGEVRFNNEEIDDFVLLRSDGTPTYMLAVVVDDHDMEVSHILRGDDHLTNAAKQILIYDAMKWEVPVMTHIPLIHGADGAKLSKRHGALGTEQYQKMGYLPEALCNYLVRLGWSHGDQEFFTPQELEKMFDLEGMGKSPSRFDMAKLDNMNGHFIRNANNEKLIGHIKTLFPEMKHVEKVLMAMEGLKEKAKNLNEMLEDARFLFDDKPAEMDEKGKSLVEDAKENLIAFAKAVETMQEWSHDDIEKMTGQFCEKHELKLGKIAQPLRIALTGGGNRLGIFYVIYALGKDEVVKRLTQ